MTDSEFIKRVDDIINEYVTDDVEDHGTDWYIEKIVDVLNEYKQDHF